MIEWKEETLIDTDIGTVWKLFSDENIKKIMPKVEEHTLMEKSETEVGAKHQQTYREGKRIETYTVDTLAYEDTPNKKLKTISFIIGKAFEIQLSFILEKIDDNHTKFIYTGHNKGVNFVGRAMMKLANKKGNQQVVHEFMKRVNQEAMML
ncbi:SRPBCC family protein [Radiobacillus sp. PE A8.2]|uniref:SRPBCC family protein n=1 Tax=Radiobacillus sp. PE A8.2 TaxID=3380349 RepID=UPI00388F847F